MKKTVELKDGMVETKYVFSETEIAMDDLLRSVARLERIVDELRSELTDLQYDD